MKDDLISRQAAIEVLRNRWLKTRNYEGIGEDIAEECEIYLKTLPSAQPVRHGKWIYSNDFHWYTASCNKCGYQRRTDIKADGWNQWKFCPNCGARMDAERKEKITIEEALEAWQKIRNMFKNGDASYVVLLNPRIVDCAIDALENQLKKDAERAEE